MTSSTFFKVTTGLVAIVAVVVIILVISSGSKPDVNGSIYSSSLTATSSKPVLSGAAFGTDTVELTVYKKGTTEKLYTSGAIRVEEGSWTTEVSEELAPGTYDVVVTSSAGTVFDAPVSGMLVIRADANATTSTSTATKPATTTTTTTTTTKPAAVTSTNPTTTTTGTATIVTSTTTVASPTTTATPVCPPGFSCSPAGAVTTVTSTTTSVTTTTTGTTSTTTLAVALVPLLQGGTARAGATVPISYLQITNIGQGNAHLKGFWVKQNGSASTDAVASLTTVDDKGGSRGTSTANPFVNGSAYAPTDAMFAPGQMRLFTIKAVINSNVSPYVGGQLMIDVTSVDTDTSVAVKGAFPIRGTTWTIAAY